MTIKRLRLQSHLVQILCNALLEGLYFCAEIPGPFWWLLAVKGVAADTDARTDGRTAVCRGASASVCAAALCVPSALFLVCLCEEEEQEPHLRKSENDHQS